MTIQEQLCKLNCTFEKLHSDFMKFESEKRNLDSKYSSLVSQVKAKYQQEKSKLEEQKEEVLKYYRIAKDNSNKELVYSGVSPQQPNLAKLNTMIERVNSYSRTDSVAGQIIDLCNAYVAYIEADIKKIVQRESDEIKNVSCNKEDEAKNLVQRKKKVLSDCEQYLRGDDVKNLVALFEMIHNDYEITPAYFSNWGQQFKRKRMMLLGFSQYFVDVPHILCPVLKGSLGHHFDENSKMVNCPCGFTTDTSEEIFVEYTDFNEAQMKQGVQALILNFLRYFKPSEYKVSVYDYIHYNADVLGPLYVFSSGKNGLIDAIPTDEKSLKQNVAMLAQYYRKIEGKIGTQSVHEFNKSCKPEERIPLRIIIINRVQENFNLSQEPEMSYVINNAKKFGITTVRLVKSMDGGSKGKDREKKFLAKATDFIRIISDSSGGFYIENDVKWMKFRWITSVNSIPTDFIAKVEAAVKPVEIGTKYFKRYQPKMPARSQGKRKSISIPFAINEDDQVMECSFENELFAAYINGAAGSGKSTLLHTIIAGLLMNYHPDELELWLLDFKMTELKKYAVHRPPHIKYLLLEKSEDLVFDIVDNLEKEMNSRKFIFSQNGWHKLSDVPTSVYMPVIFVIIDEFAQMSQILKDTKGSGVGSDYAMKLENILREGRAVGFKFIFSSQTYSDGVEGLTESARKQIQQRLAMKNTYQEIKDTLALSSDSISPAIQNAMNTLPPYESLFKWLTPDGRLKIDHLRNMYTEDNQVDDLIDQIVSHMHCTSDLQIQDETSFVDKKPILIDGAQPKTFKSQIAYYKAYETPDVLDELDDDDVLIYPGVPCSFSIARPFTMMSGSAENILIVGGNRENELSVVLSIFNSYSRKQNPVEIWASEKSSMYKRYKTSILGKYDAKIFLEDICDEVDKIKKKVQKRVSENRLILVLGYETLVQELELLDSEPEEKEVPVPSTLVAPEDLSEVVARAKACGNPEEGKRIIADYNQRVAEYEASRNAEKTAEKHIGEYDARDDIEWIVKRASSLGIHFVFCFEQGKDFLNTKLDERAFRHKIVFAMSRDDSNEIIGNRKANEIGEGVCIYTNGKDTFTMHPHLYKGVPCNGWQIDDDGKVVQRV